MTTQEAVDLGRTVIEALRPYQYLDDEHALGLWAKMLAEMPYSARHVERAFFALYATVDPRKISPALVAEKATQLEPTDRPLLDAPSEPYQRRVPGVAPTRDMPGLRARQSAERYAVPLIRSSDVERALMRSQAMRQHGEARERGVFKTRAKVRDMVGGIFAKAIARRKGGGPRIGGTFCDWCDRNFDHVDELGEYFDWLDQTHGDTGEIGERVFGRCCAYKALIERPARSA